MTALGSGEIKSEEGQEVTAYGSNRTRLCLCGKSGYRYPLQGPSLLLPSSRLPPTSHLTGPCVTFPRRQLHPTAMTLHSSCPCSMVGQTCTWEQREPGGLKVVMCLCFFWHPDPLGAVPVGCRIGMGEPGHPRGECTATLPPAPFHTGGQYPFYQHLPLMMLFSVNCPSSLATLSSQPLTGLLGTPQLCQALPQPHTSG